MQHTVLFIGHSKLPQGSAARYVSETLAMSFVLDPCYGVIIDVSTTLVTTSAVETLRDILVGKNFAGSLDATVSELRARYHGAALPAIEAALKDAQIQWQRWRDSRKTT